MHGDGERERVPLYLAALFVRLRGRRPRLQEYLDHLVVARSTGTVQCRLQVKVVNVQGGPSGRETLLVDLKLSFATV